MCGRFANTNRAKELTAAFKVHFPQSMGHNRPPRWNVAPGTEIETIISGEPREITLAHWGIENPASTRPLINARGETMFDKPTFSDMAREHRCLVVASGWYEWKEPKKPYFIRYGDAAPMAMAGLYRLTQGKPHAVIVTRGATGGLGEVHHRAPLLLKDDALEQWLAPDSPQDALQGLVSATDGTGLAWYPVSSEVGSVAQNHEGLVQRDDNHGQRQAELF